MNDRYSELNDAAQLQQDKTNRDAIAAVQARNAPETHPNFDGTNCIGCDEPIPQARLKLHKIRCIKCQQIFERKQ